MPSDFYNLLFNGPASDIANYLGLLLTLIGFGITVVAVKKSRRASEDAKNEVQKVRQDIKNIDVVNDLTIAIVMIEEIRDLQRESRWNILPYKFSLLKEKLISIKKTYPGLSENQKTIMQNTIQHVSDIDHKLEIALKKDSEPTNIPKINLILSQQKDSVYEMLIDLKATIGAK